jgi:hypothetical protein
MDVTNEDLDLIQIPGSIYRMAFAFRSQILARVNADFLIAAAKGQPVKDVSVEPELVVRENAKDFYVYPDSSIVRKTACHGAILGFVMGHDLRRLFVSR